MKKIFLAFGLAAGLLPAYAQEYDHSFEYSAFSNYRHLKSIDQKAVMATQEILKNVFPGWKLSANKLNGKFDDIYGNAISIPGSTIAAKVQYLFANQLKTLGVEAAEWKQVNTIDAPHAQYVYFKRQVSGRDVAFGTMSMRFTKEGKLVRIKMKNEGAPAQGVTAVLSANEALRTPAMTTDLATIKVTDKKITGDWLWFPIPGNGGYTMHPVWAYSVTGTTAENFPVQFTGYIDAIDGNLLYRNNEVHAQLDVHVKGDVNKQNLVTPPVFAPEGLADLRIEIAGVDYYTNDTGMLTDPSLTAPIPEAITRLDGYWSSVRVGQMNTLPTPDTFAIGTGDTEFILPALTTAKRRYINAFYHVNVVHDYMKIHIPTSSGFTDLDSPLPTVVDVAGSCNAFYNGSSINFYSPAGSCNSFAEVPDVVYHEYGHGISGRFYNFVTGNGMRNGAMNEANSDIWAISITHDPVLGRNSYTTGGSIRQYNTAPKVYPLDIQGEVHADGEILAGAWWDVSQNIGDIDTMSAIFGKTYYDVPDGPNGTEGLVYHEILISALLNDDDDGLLSNGTPHFSAIIEGFAKHGIYLLADASLTHQELPHQESGQDITVNAALSFSQPDFFNQLRLVYRNRTNAPTQWDSVVMTDNGGFNFTGTIPAQPSATIIDYYFVVSDPLNASPYSFPAGYSSTATASQVSIPYQFGINMRRVTGNDFEDSTAVGWTIGNVASDNASSGKWILAKPVGSFYNTMPVQPGIDHTTGTGFGKCLVTGNAPNSTANVNSADVDGGRTTILTPLYDISGYANPAIEYYRWFCNDRGNSNNRSNLWTVQIHTEGSALWKGVDNTLQSDYTWRRRVFHVSEYLPGTTDKIQMRFVATDATNGTVEAAVDDFFIYDAWTAGVDNVQAKKANVYPNPADDNVTIVLPQATAGTITLSDITGRTLYTVSMNDGTANYNIKTSALASGQYIVTIQTGKTIQSVKVVVSH